MFRIILHQYILHELNKKKEDEVFTTFASIMNDQCEGFKLVELSPDKKTHKKRRFSGSFLKWTRRQ